MSERQAPYKLESSDMNVRGVSQDFHRKARAWAVMHGMSLKDLVVKAVEAYMKANR